MNSWQQMVVVGRVARVHGLRGGVVIDPETDFPDARFQPGGVVYRSGAHGEVEALRVAAFRMHRGRPIVAFEGIESIEQAESLAGVELRVPEASLVRLPENSFYQHDLIGCRVEMRSGTVIGTVERVEGDGGASRLAVAAAGGDVLVPLAADICVSIDVRRKVIVVEPPEGLLELNEVRHHHHLSPDVRRAARAGHRRTGHRARTR